MGLIKSVNAPPGAQAFSMRDIESQARSILLRARQQAEQLLAVAQGEAEQLRQRAAAEGQAEGQRQGMQLGREAGLRAGRDEALKQHREALTQAVSALTAAMQQLEAQRRELEIRAVEDVIRLAVAIAQRVTRRLGEVDPAVAVANVADALRFVAHTSDVRVAVHPGQRAILAESMQQLKLQWPKLGHVELVEDPQLAPGGCRIYTAQGSVDGDLEVQLQRVVADLLPTGEGAG